MSRNNETRAKSLPVFVYIFIHSLLCKITFKFILENILIYHTRDAHYIRQQFFFLVKIFEIGDRIRFDGALELRKYGISFLK